MAITTLSSIQFDQDIELAKKAAAAGAVFITEHGEAAYVLISIGEFRRITGRRSIIDALSMPGLSDIELDSVRSSDLARNR